MLRREALIRTGLVTYYSNVLISNKIVTVDPIAYAHVPWTVAHLALENVYDKNDSPETIITLLRNITCFNSGLLNFLLNKGNIFTL